MLPLRHQALAVRRLLVQWQPGRAAPSHRSGKALSAAPVVVCGGIQHNGVLCKACAPVKAPALRVRIRGRYVLRPSGKYRHTSQSQIPSLAVRGSKTGLVYRRPSAFYCLVGYAVSSCLFICCRCAGLIAAEAHFIYRGNVTPPLPVAGSCLRRSVKLVA